MGGWVEGWGGGGGKLGWTRWRAGCCKRDRHRRILTYAYGVKHYHCCQEGNREVPQL